MLRAVETPHSGVGTCSTRRDSSVRQIDFASGQKFCHVPPVHADDGDCSISAPLGRGAEGPFQKGRELHRGHLSRAHREFPVADAA
jgi:hypothetical protein